MQSSDSSLIRLLKEGNVKVFESVYTQFQRQLFIYSREYVVSEEMSKEIVQDTFLKLWEVRESLSEDTNLQSFLYRITRNICLNYLKHLKVEDKYRNYSKAKKKELELNELALNQSAAEKIISEELSHKIDSVINSFPPRCKEIFILSRYREKKYREIAEELNISVKTVENQILKALKILRENLNRD